MKTCGICINDSAATKFIECPHCKHEACFDCVKTYITDQTNEIKCMSCRKEWDQPFIYRNFPYYIIYKTFKKTRELCLFEKEKALLPDTQMVMEKEQKIKNIDNEIAAYKRRISELKDVKYINFGGFVKEEEKTNIKVICSCPMDSCRGFIMADYACGLCLNKICKSCRNVSNEEGPHECKQEDIDTIKLLQKDSKQCPSCCAMSKKIEGCSQVWCLNCKTTWDWNTGKIEKGATHATDYYNYLRRTQQHIPRTEGDAAGRGGACVNIGGFPQRLTRDKNIGKAKSDVLYGIYRNFAEFQYIAAIQQKNNIDLRKQYLCQTIDDKKFKMMLTKREKEYVFSVEMFNMIQAYQEGIRDLIGHAIQDNDINKYYEHIVNFNKLMQSEFDDLCVFFKSTRKNIFKIKNLANP